MGRGKENLTKLIIYIPIDRYNELMAHVKSINSSASKRARELLLADMDQKKSEPLSSEIISSMAVDENPS